MSRQDNLAGISACCLPEPAGEKAVVLISAGKLSIPSIPVEKSGGSNLGAGLALTHRGTIREPRCHAATHGYNGMVPGAPRTSQPDASGRSYPATVCA
jgi:hypothetical protein